MIKLLNVKSLGNSKFEVQFECEGKLKKEIVSNEEHEVGDMGRTVAVIVAENPEFYDFWGQSLEFRKEVSSSINSLKEDKLPELQAA